MTAYTANTIEQTCNNLIDAKWSLQAVLKQFDNEPALLNTVQDLQKALHLIKKCQCTFEKLLIAAK